MTRDPVGRRGVGIRETARQLDTGTILAIILVSGLLLRVLIAGVLLPASGFVIDVGDFTAWGQRMADVGPGAFYADDYFSDYPPGYMYVLWALGAIGGALAPLVGQDATGGLVKIPGILADVGVAWLLYRLAADQAGQLLARRWRAIGPETLGLAAATVYLFNPGVIFDSAVWGQIDSVGTLVLLATLAALARGWTEVAAVGAVVALLVKFQFAFAIPIVAIVGLKRHLAGRSSDPVHDGRREPLRVLSSLGAGVATLLAGILPFGMNVFAAREDGPSCFGFPHADPTRSLIGKFCEAAETYTGLTVNAFNVWRNPWSGLGDTLHWGDDTAVGLALGGMELTWQQVGTALFAIVAVIALVQLLRRDDLRGLLLVALVLAIAFFVLPTRVHERYLFPALALAAPLLLSGRAWPWIYGALSLSFFANIYWVYTADWSFAGRILTPGVGGEPMPRDPLLAATLFTDAGIWLMSLLSVVTLVVVGFLAVRGAGRGSEAAAIEEERPAAPPRPRPSHDAPPAPASGPRWLRPNAADAYLREPGRRLDRRDALLLLAIVVIALVFRLWRLDVPRAQHFDEVYHARSAAEFLSSWRNGWDRDVYEWTHPMLAKYLIAGGMVLADPNRVVAEAPRPLDGPGPLAVAPRRSAAGHDRSVVFALSPPSTIVAHDAETLDELVRWHVGAPVAALAYDREGPRLLVGRADGGVIETYELAALLASPDGRAPPPRGPSIVTELETVSEIVVPDSASDPILARGANGAAVLDRDTDAVLATAPGAFGGIGFVHGVEDDGDRVVLSEPGSGELVFLDAGTLGEQYRMGVDAPLVGPLLVRGSGNDQQLLALTGPLPASDGHPATAGGLAAVDADGRDSRCADDPCLIGLAPLPGAGTHIGLQRVAGIVYVLGATPEGESQAWAIEPHVERRGEGTIGLAVFDATPLPGTAVAMSFDVASWSQADDRGRLILTTLDADGTARLVELDAGSNAFAWRLAGVIFGSLLAGLVFLLAATMVSRRRVAVLAGAFIAVDPMSYVMSRIAMNDIFVAAFIVAAYLVFWQVWSGRWRRSAWWAMPLAGVLIGLAAASKWVGFYALAGLLVLALARSALGRLVLVGLAALAAVVGGIGAPWPFTLVMLGILALALLIAWARPVRVDVGEAMTAIPATAAVVTGITLAFVVAYGSIEAPDPAGPVELVFSLLARGAEAGWPAWLMLGGAGLLLAARAWTSLRDPASDARWHRPGELGGFAWSWIGACLVVIPLTVYSLSYLPYLQLGHAFAIPDTGPGYGWSLDQLHRQMYGYHFNLTAGHASAAPWWSWPMALKPTWLFNGSYDGDQLAVIYNGGNPILFWAGIPALAAAGVLAWRRRSAALVLVVAAFAFQFVPWIRIERATFAYHYLTALPFAMIAIAYMVDELLRRPAWRELAVGYLALVAVVGLLIFPLGAALPMPDWYINAARALPPWNYAFQFPDPPSGDRAELLAGNGALMLLGLVAAGAAMAFAVLGRRRWPTRRDDRDAGAVEPAGPG